MQNRSSAVMAQRLEPPDSLDDFPTPPWATRALMEHVLIPMGARRGCVWEPACNRGHMAKPLSEYFSQVRASDAFDYGIGAPVHDFLCSWPVAERLDWVTTNPPFRLAEQFISRALEIADEGCAVLVRSSFAEGVDRYKKLYRDRPPTVVAQFAERVIMHKGVLRDPSKLYWDPDATDPKTGQKGCWKKPSTATSYCWMVWMPERPRLPTMWIPPCRSQLEREADYEVST